MPPGEGVIWGGFLFHHCNAFDGVCSKRQHQQHRTADLPAGLARYSESAQNGLAGCRGDRCWGRCGLSSDLFDHSVLLLLSVGGTAVSRSAAVSYC